MNVGYIIGSLSAGSINRKLVNGLNELASQRTNLHLTEISIGELSLYDRERDDDYPPEAIELKRAIRASDGLLICTPEYNRSIPGALKNAIDWASRPYGDNAFAGKPVGVIGASPGAIGTSLAQQHLRNILAYLDAPTLGQPEAFIQFSDERFDESGRIIDDETREFLGDWLVALEEWIARVGPSGSAAGDAGPIESEAMVGTPLAGAPSDNVSMIELLDALDADGFGAQFLPRDGGDVECSNCGATVPAGDLNVAVARRLEGASDPDDMSTVYAATCPACKTGGTIVLGYGVNASGDEIAIGHALSGAS
ncbi:MAG TPA: NADPH-dependent FMN reductase [Ilumatobacter sp.]|nr:NADPH-dependent FMN reductase [Ilumatobacter sp.]